MSQKTSSLSFQHLAPELRLYCGDDSLLSVSKELGRSGCQRAVVVSGPSVSQTAAMGQLRAALGPLLAGECTAVQPNSPLSAVEAVAQALEQFDADCVVAVGGGSAAVTARAASILLAEGKPASELCTRRKTDGGFDSPRLAAPKLPQFIVPSTPSTAFVKAGSAVHDGVSGQRLALFDPKTRAQALFVHPSFLETAPPQVVLGAALNTLSTAIEALESPKCDPLSEALLVQAVKLVAGHLGCTGADVAGGLENLVIAGILCGRGTEQSGGGLSSVLAHAMGHRANLSNGFINAIVLPHTMRFNAPATSGSAQRIAQAFKAGADDGSGTEQAIEALEDFLAKMGIPRTLRETGLSRADLDGIAEAAMRDWFISRAPRQVSGVADLRGILDAAW